MNTKIREAMKVYGDGHLMRAHRPPDERAYNEFVEYIVKNAPEKFGSEAILDFFFECKEKAERKHYERLFSHGNDIDEPEITAVRHLEWALTDIAESNKDWF